MYCRALSKQDLIDMGIERVYWDGEWIVLRYWFKNNSKSKKEHTRVKITQAIRRHKYGPDRVYDKVQFSYRGTSMAIPLGRFLYAWFKGDIPEGAVVDHHINDPKNNSLDNLRLLSIKENLDKRYEDNPETAVNQWVYRR